MAVTFDAVGPSSAGAGSANPASPVTWSHTVGANATFLLLAIAVGVRTTPSHTAGNEDSDFVLTTITANGRTMTLVPGSVVHANNGRTGYSALYYLVSPDIGVQTISVAFTNANANVLDAIELGTCSFNGVDLGTPFRNVTSAVGLGTTPSVVVSSADNNMVVDVVAVGGTISSSGQTNRWTKNNNTNTGGGNGASSTAAGAGSVTMSYTTLSDTWAIVGLDLQATVPLATVLWARGMI